jgi:hypothetical protein
MAGGRASKHIKMWGGRGQGKATTKHSTAHHGRGTGISIREPVRLRLAVAVLPVPAEPVVVIAGSIDGCWVFIDVGLSVHKSHFSRSRSMALPCFCL